MEERGEVRDFDARARKGQVKLSAEGARATVTRGDRDVESGVQSRSCGEDECDDSLAC